METSTQYDVNFLLTKARQFRTAATATTQPDYRAKMLKTARQLETQASEVEGAWPGAATGR